MLLNVKVRNYINDFVQNNILLLNLNPRVTSPVFNFRLRKLFLQGVNFYYWGSFALFSFYMKYISNDFLVLNRLLEGKH